MVEIEERGLRAFEQHVLAGLERLVHEADRVGDVGLEPRRRSSSRYSARDVVAPTAASWL